MEKTKDTPKLIDGKALAETIKTSVTSDVAKFTKTHGRAPGLSVIVVGDNPASHIYVNNKQRVCEKVGIMCDILPQKEGISRDKLVALIKKLNKSDTVDGILVQLPLPKHLDERDILSTISPTKDVDGFHTQSAGALFLGESGLRPATPAGCMELIKSTGVDLVGKHAVVIGRSNIVGKPMAMMLLEQHCTVTIAHSRTQDLPALCRTADILVVAIGRAKMVTADYIKPGAIVIDVGINRVPDSKKILGDVDFDAVYPVTSHITPVPGGVGPMTIAMLLKNTLAAAENRSKNPA